MRSVFQLLLSLLVLTGCTQPVELSIDLNTDLVPGLEFSVVHVRVDGELSNEIPVSQQDVFLDPPRRIMDLANLSPTANRGVGIQLSDVAGNQIAQTFVIIDNRRDQAVTITLARSCVGVVCPDAGSDPVAMACLAGVCVDPKCVEGTEAECGGGECNIAEDCAPPLQSCLTVQCLGAQCVYGQANLCASEEYCDPQAGCTTDEVSCGGSCADGNPCTFDTCDADECRNQPLADGTPCRGGVCEAGTCTGASCIDGVQNQDETGIDCGGSCNACPTCSDGEQNGTETGIDCGGDCMACATCSDGVQNGSETGVDCGGPSCNACATCSDGVQNGNESGIDCGGPSCAACAGTCFDGILNGTETGVDCGGTCMPCATSYDCSGVTTIPVSECQALVALYDSTDGANWRSSNGWLTGNPCNWSGVICRGGHVDDLNLSSNNLVGPIPTQIGALTELTILRLHSSNGVRTNTLTGEIPSSIGNLTKLTLLNLERASLSGEIPPEIGNLTSLSDIRLPYNQLSGTIPTEIGNLVNAVHFRLDENQLSGTVPDSIVNVGSAVNAMSFVLRGQTECLTNMNPATLDFLQDKDPLWSNGC